METEAEAARAQAAEERRKQKEELNKKDKELFFSSGAHGQQYFTLKRVIGRGAYGIVCSAMNTVTGEEVAVKRVTKILNSPSMATRILRELKFLRLLMPHENIIKIKDVLVPGDGEKFNDAFMVLEIMPTDLHRLLNMKTKLSGEHVKYLMFQLFRGLHYMHSCQVFHRDLKPNNILINKQCDLRICDFGLARAMFENTAEMVYWTDYVATRWYRAPELIMAYFTNYSTAIDIWSAGCIFAEVLSGGKPLFPGRNQYHQFELITEVTGRPPPEAIERLRSEEAKRYVTQLPVRPRRPLDQIFPDADPLALDLLQQLLAFDPEKRISCYDALQHPYFNEYRHLGLGTIGTPFPPEEFDFEQKVNSNKMTPDEMRLEFLREIAHYHPKEVHELLRPQKGAYTFSDAAHLAAQLDDELSMKDTKRSTRTLPKEALTELSSRSTASYRSTTMSEAELRKEGGLR
ncbi:Mitogen-activated protein kinase 14 [Porphyridium purpureum]|uniref:Mitogen-activated protein kinase 14 n=1 Tax=Porphyridium purpureum TaxID=35688 RepID=A0A5J4YWQ7_PORPP|nr:Mitogen-activated protein kinase 14 [Porphyridium purpureum]|eukprot:POR4674..scf209_3